MKKVVKGFFLTIAGAVVLFYFVYLAYSLWAVIAFFLAAHEYSNGGSLEPTREAIGGYSSEEVEALWLANPAVESYELEMEDKSGKGRYGREFYEVNYDLIIRIKPGYTYVDPKELSSAAYLSAWNTKDKAPEGKVKVTILAPEDENLEYEWETDKIEETLGPWTGGELPKLDGIFKEFKITGGIILRTDPLSRDSSVEVYQALYGKTVDEAKTVSCVFVSLGFEPNIIEDLYSETMTIEIYQNDEIIKSIPLKRKQNEEEHLERFCYDEIWDLKNTSGFISWPAAEDFNRGKLEAWVGTNRGSSMEKSSSLRGEGRNLLE